MFNQLFGNKKRNQLSDLTTNKITSYLKWEEAQDLNQVYQAMLNGLTLRSEIEDQKKIIEYLPASVHYTEVNFEPQIFYLEPNYQKIGYGKFIEAKYFKKKGFHKVLYNPRETEEIGKIKISPILPPIQNKVKWYLKRIYYISAIIRRTSVYGIIAHLIGRQRFDRIYHHLSEHKKRYIFSFLSSVSISALIGFADSHYFDDRIITPHLMSGVGIGISLTYLGSFY